jgi:hypothetical protein
MLWQYISVLCGRAIHGGGRKELTVLFGHVFVIILGLLHTCNPSVQSFIYIEMFIPSLKLFGSLGQTVLILSFYDFTDSIRGWFYGLAFALQLC